MFLYRYSFLFILSFCVLNVQGQTLSGNVLDATTNEVLPSATVFISGTTIGTYTDENGHFELKGIPFPCQLSVSMVGFKSQALMLEEQPELPLKIKLEEQNVELEKVSVEGKNNRQLNLYHFENNFLGGLDYRMESTLKNPDQLFFKVESENKVKNGVLFEKRLQLEVVSNDLLKIDSPQLGYEIDVDLRSFVLKYGLLFQGDTVSYNGLYFFKPHKKITKRHLKNRKKAYYNSRLHFLRALYEKKLGDNGYLVMEVLKDSISGNEKYVLFDIYSYLTIDKEKNQALLKGVGGKNLSILYYGKAHKPRNLQKHKPKGQPLASPLIPLSDEILITKEGTSPYNQLLFGGEIGKKQVGAMLPLDYYPPE